MFIIELLQSNLILGYLTYQKLQVNVIPIEVDALLDYGVGVVDAEAEGGVGKGAGGEVEAVGSGGQGR